MKCAICRFVMKTAEIKRKNTSRVIQCEFTLYKRLLGWRQQSRSM